MLLAALLAAPAETWALKVTLLGLFPGKAVIAVNDGPLRTISTGQKQPENITLLGTQSNSAEFDIEGKRTTLEIGELYAPPGGGAASVTLSADSKGHFLTVGQVNGRSVRFLVDTGASSVALPAAIAHNAGIDFRKGMPVAVQTANGRALAFRIVLDTVTVGDITLYQVEALVHEGAGMEVALLGMSFLNRVEMKRAGQSMLLTKRF